MQRGKIAKRPCAEEDIVVMFIEVLPGEQLLSTLAQLPQVPLTRGSGARRLMEAKCRISIQLLMVQACGEIWQKHAQRLNLRATVLMLDMLAQQGAHAREINSDSGLRRELAIAQLQDKVRNWPLHSHLH